MAAVAGIDHRAGDFLGQKRDRTRFRMAHDQHIRVHRVQRHSSIDQRLALLNRGRTDRHIDRVRAEPFARELERGAGAGRILEKQIDLGPATEERELLVRLPVQLDIRVGKVKQIGYIAGRKPFDSKQVTMRKRE